MAEVAEVQTPKGAPALPRITIPEGKFATPTQDIVNRLRVRLGLNTPNREQNFHNVTTREFTINGQRRNIELVHQVRAGDCVLANFLNTTSVELDGHLPMTITEARQAAIRLRQVQGRDTRDIIAPDSPLDYGDVINLFSAIHGQAPEQEDVLTVEGRGKSPTQLRLDALNILEYLDTYDSGLCTTGLGYHSRTIKKMEGDQYAIIDPMNPNGLQFMDTTQIVDFLAWYTANSPENDNFFFFIRK